MLIFGQQDRDLATFYGERVERGIMEVLDGSDPAWFVKVNRLDLDMKRPAGCIFGQLFGDYWVKRDELGWTEETSAEHGFTALWAPLAPGEQMRHFRILTEVWRNVLEVLQDAGVCRHGWCVLSAHPEDPGTHVDGTGHAWTEDQGDAS